MSRTKDDTILWLIERLPLKKHNWLIRDHWVGDLCAIGITNHKDEGRLVYVSTFNKTRGRFDFECEESRHAGQRPAVVARGDDVDFPTLLSALISYLG